MKHEPSYCDEALAQLDPMLTLAKAKKVKIGPITTTYLEDLVKLLKRSIKFKVPPNGKFFNTEKNTAEILEIAGSARLPFKDVALEFVVETGQYAGAKSILLLSEEPDPSGDPERFVIVFRTLHYYPANEEGPEGWDASPKFFKMYFPLQEGGRTEFLDTSDDIAKKEITEEFRNKVIAGAGSVVHIWAEFLAALSCKNLNRILKEPAKSVNRLRQARGKPPYFSYHVLEIEQHQGSGEHLGGTHASPRVHLRRGHIRRLPKGNVWVNAAVVGSSKLGAVEKSYVVKPQQ